MLFSLLPTCYISNHYPVYIVLHLATERSISSIFQYSETSTQYSTQIMYNSIDKMAQGSQPQPYFVDIHMNHGKKVKFEPFKMILDGRFNSDTMQLAFEQYLGDFKIYGAAYRTFRYRIDNGNVFQLHDFFNPFPAGPAFAAPVTQLGRRNANAQTQFSGHQTPYGSQLNQPAANSLGPVDPSTVQNMSYPPASTAPRSVSLPHKLNPEASEFRVGSAVNIFGASAPPSASPRAVSAPARTTGLQVSQQPQSAPSNAHRGFFAPDGLLNARQVHDSLDTIPRSVDNNREAARAVAAPPKLITPYSPILPRPVLTIPPQPQLGPRKPRRDGLTLNTRLEQSDGSEKAAGSPDAISVLADRMFDQLWNSIASPSTLDLNATSSPETIYASSSPHQWSSHTSEDLSDASSHSSSDSDGDQSPGFGRFNQGYRLPVPVSTVSKFDWSPYRTANDNYSKTASSAIKNDEVLPWDPLLELTAGKYGAFYSHLYQKWRRSVGSDTPFRDFLLHLRSLPESLRAYHDMVGLRRSQGRSTTPPPSSSVRRSDTGSQHNESPPVRNGTNTSQEMAEVDTSASRTQIMNAYSVAVPISPPPQLHHGERGSEINESSGYDPLPAIEAQQEAQPSVEEEEADPDLRQRLDAHSLLTSNTLAEVRTTMRDAERVLG